MSKMIRQAVNTTLILALLLLAVAASKAEDAAVLAAINDYKIISRDLKYCESDAMRMKETLIKYLGIKEENIKMLLGKKATRRGIRLAITDWLKNRIKHGDRAIFYFSGHGVQCKDLNGDEDDKKDELLCAYDSGTMDTTFVKDDDLKRWFNKINTDFKLVILDCCHSGTGTKDVLVGGLLSEEDVPMIKEGHLPPGMKVEVDPKSAVEGQARGVEDDSTILISGCRADQVSMESPTYKQGVLTYYFTEVLNSMADANKDKVVTIEEAVEEATKRIKKKGWKQDPQLEGDYKGKVLIGKRELKETTYGTIDKMSAGVITVSLGQAHNVVKGSIYNVFDSTAFSFPDGSHKGRIVIDDVMANHSYARKMEGTAALNVGDKVVEYQRHFQSEKLLLLVEPFEAKDQNSRIVAKGMKTSMERAFGKEEYVEIISGGKAPDKILRGSVASGSDGKYVIQARLVDVRRAEGKDYGPIEATYFKAADSIAELIIRREIRYSYVLRFLAKLENTKSTFRINLAVDKGRYYIREEDPERVTVTVQPTRNCYIYLLNIGSSGAITVIFPNAFEPDNFVRAGQKYVIPSTDNYVFEVGGPQGQESVKAIATIEKLNFARLKPGDTDNPFKYYKDDVRDTLEITMKDLRVKPLNKWATESVTYQLVLPDDGM